MPVVPPPEIVRLIVVLAGVMDAVETVPPSAFAHSEPSAKLPTGSLAVKPKVTPSRAALVTAVPGSVVAAARTMTGGLVVTVTSAAPGEENVVSIVTASPVSIRSVAAMDTLLTKTVSETEGMNPSLTVAVGRPVQRSRMFCPDRSETRFVIPAVDGSDALITGATPTFDSVAIRCLSTTAPAASLM